MNPNRTPGGACERRDPGFTLVEILIAIVLVGILSAVVVVGVGSLTDQGEASACAASKDASKAAAVVYFAQEGEYASSFETMVEEGALTLADDVTIDDTEKVLTGSGWTLTLTGDGTAAPTFACA